MARISSNIEIDGAYLKTFIEGTGMTQADIAESVGRAPSYIGNCTARGYIQKPVLELFTKLYAIDVARLCPPEAEEEPEKPQEAEAMTWDDLNMATVIDILLRIEKRLDAMTKKEA